MFRCIVAIVKMQLLKTVTFLNKSQVADKNAIVR